MNKVKIAGAGLSGLAVAINLAKAGNDVEIFELNKDCGCRFHGDLQGIENWSYGEDAILHLKNMGIEINFKYKPISSIILTNNKESITIRTKKASFYLLKRGPYENTLDQSLKNQAMREGVKINFNKKLDERKADIIATGPIGKKVFGIDNGVVFETEQEDIAEMLLGDEFGYKGYSYLLVLDGYACMCTVLFDNFSLVKDCLKKTKEFFSNKYKLKIKNPKNVGGIGHYDVRGNYVKGNRLYVGESAGIQDMLFGFGIRSSLYSGYLAAQSIINSKDYVENYEKIAKSEFSKRLKAGLVNRFFWTKMGKDYSFVIKMLKKSKDPIKLIDGVYNYSIIHRMCFPFVYLFNK